MKIPPLLIVIILYFLPIAIGGIMAKKKPYKTGVIIMILGGTGFFYMIIMSIVKLINLIISSL